MFVGRKKELQALQDLSHFSRASLVVITGRRRIGKSRLVAEFAQKKRFLSFMGLTPAPGIQAQDQRDAFAHQYTSQFLLPPCTFLDWSDTFAHVTSQLTQEPTVILFDEISWMGSLDPSFVPKLKLWWDLVLQKYPHVIFIMCGSVSIWIEENIINSTEFFGRITLNLHLDELSLPECNQFLRERGISCS